MKRLLHGILYGGRTGCNNQSRFPRYWYLVILSSLILLVAAGPAAAASAPVASFSATPTTGAAPLDVVFTNSSSGSPTGWAWYFGDENYTAPWTEMNGNSPWPARFDHTSVVLPNGSIVIMAGTPDNTNAMRDVWQSSDGGTTWTELNANANWTERIMPSSVVLPDGSIVIMGGTTGGFSPSFLNDTWRSTDNGRYWALMNASSGWPSRQSQSTVVLPDGSIVLMGGSVSTAPYRSNDVWRSADRGATWTLVNASAGWPERYGHASVVLPDGSIVLMGGDIADGAVFSSDVWRSTDQGATWARVNASAGWSTRVNHNAVAMPDGSIVLMGGLDSNFGSPFRNDTWRSTDQGATWTRVNESAGWPARQAASSVVLPDGSIVVTGGENSAYTSMNDVWRLMPAGSSEQNSSHTYTTPGNYSVALQVFNNEGYNSTRKTGYITVFARPAITGISPKSGSLTGNTVVTITGTGFNRATAVKFGTTKNTTPLTVVSATRITVRSPAHAAGITDVTVTTPGGTSATSTADRFTYAVLPNVTNITPKSGPLTGNTVVTINGTGFTGATAVRFGVTKNTTPLTVVSATRITVRSPAHAAGITNVTVTTPGGTSATSTADRFTYAAPRPTVTKISPTSGSKAGGALVTVTGTGFTGATAVRFGTSAGTSRTVVSATKITIISPAHATGVVNVTVTTPGGTSAIVAGDKFTYDNSPTVTALSPDHGPAFGVTTVSITGTGFTGATAVRFGTTAGTSLTVNSSTQITIKSPARAGGTVDVRVTTPNGTSAISPADRFTYMVS